MHRLPVLALTLLVVFAGCLGSPFAPSPPDISGGSDGTTGSPAAVDRTSGGDATGTTATDSSRPNVVANRSNPWGDDPVVVAVDAPDGREVAPLVRRATAFWEANAPRYAGYAIDYEVRPDAADPDIVVQFPDRITSCDNSHDAAGCAPYLTHPEQIDRPVVIEVRNGLSDDSTVLVLEHEFGHTLGLGHDSEPQRVMRTGVVLTTLPQTNATDRAFPWDDSEFTVYVDVSDADDPAAARAQVDHALNYYEQGAPGMPSNLSFRVVEDPEADLVVRYVESSSCTPGSGSCGSARGVDPDGDGASETYTQFTVTVVGIDTPAIGWHTGYWLASAFGAEDESEKPPPFRDASYRERRSEWWR